MTAKNKGTWDCNNKLAQIENQYTGRKQTAGINGSFSCWQAVAGDVPRGSVLGAELFTMYVNNLDEGAQCNASYVADERKIDGE